MKRNDIKALQEKSVVELQKMVVELNEELAKARLAKAARKPLPKGTPSTISDDIARVKTIMTQK